MWRRIPAVQSASLIVVVLLNVVALMPPVQDWFSRNYPYIDPRWIYLVFFLIFCGVMYWIIHGLYENIQDLESKQTLLDVRPITYWDDHLLSVTNNGECGIFSAQISILPSNTGNIKNDILALHTGYTALWGSTKTGESEIKKGQSDSIKIATVRITKTTTSLDLIGYDVANQSPFTALSAAWTPSVKNISKPEYWLQVNISSDPSPKGGAFVRNYKVGLNYIEESRLQPKPNPTIKLLGVIPGEGDDSGLG